MRSITVALAMATITAAGAFNAIAGFGKHHCNSHECRQCPNCNYVCKLTAEKVDEDKTGFDVESKVICIPRVVFPWQKKCNPCANNGARLRTVCVLTTEKYKCPKCEYTWKAEQRPDPCTATTSDADAVKSELVAPLPNPQNTALPSEQSVTHADPLAYGMVDPQRDAPIVFQK